MKPNEFDKLYILLAEQNKQQLFNFLCYNLGVAGLFDIHNISKSTVEKNYGDVVSGEIKIAIESLPRAREKIDFDDLGKVSRLLDNMEL